MAEPNEAPPIALAHGRSDGDGALSSLFSLPIVVVQTASATGYGLWMVLGTALALGLYPDGRGDVLAPLSIGLVLVGVGLVATCLRLPFAPEWHGWNPVKRMMPTPEGMIAMATFLPMLALGGLARGGNDFWATRLAGAVLMLCSLATLVYTARGDSRGLRGPVASMANTLPSAGRSPPSSPAACGSGFASHCRLRRRSIRSIHGDWPCSGWRSPWAWWRACVGARCASWPRNAARPRVSRAGAARSRCLVGALASRRSRSDCPACC